MKKECNCLSLFLAKFHDKKIKNIMPQAIVIHEPADKTGRNTFQYCEDLSF